MSLYPAIPDVSITLLFTGAIDITGCAIFQWV